MFQQLEDRLTADYRELEDLLYHNMEQTVQLMEALRHGQKKTMYHQTEEGVGYKEEANKHLRETEILKKNVSSDPKSVCIKVRLKSSIKYS